MKIVIPKIYLAGPGVFRPDAAELGASLKDLCTRYRCKGLWPADNDPPNHVKLLHQKAEYIYLHNMLMVRAADAILADISPFRGPHMDCGTAFEVGAAIAMQKPVFAYTSDLGDLACRIPFKIVDGVMRAADGSLVEHFGAPENLMISCSVQVICTSAEEALQHCVKHLRSAA